MVTMMQCGHSANATEANGGKPVCVICWPKPESEMVVDTPDLTGRMAECAYNKRRVPSSADLAFFRHQPEKPYDSYYCGCMGWD